MGKVFTGLIACLFQTGDKTSAPPEIQEDNCFQDRHYIVRPNIPSGRYDGTSAAEPESTEDTDMLTQIFCEDSSGELRPC